MASSRWSDHASAPRGADYDARWERLAASGESVHGEADFVMRFSPATVLDAGCGTGRVAIELARRGVEVVGVDLDAPMLSRAREKAPDLTWIEADLLDVDLDLVFDVVVLAGNVMIFLAAGTEADVVANLARLVRPGGVLVAGFQLGRPYGIDAYDGDCAASGLERIGRWSTWSAAPWSPTDPASRQYAVSAHRRPTLDA